MRENTRDWQRWRVTVAAAAPGPAVARYARPVLNVAAAERPGPDGIRHGLVARVRQEIAAGTYDTEERWRAAEDRLLARIESGV
jgi:hypothetical protein